MQDGQMDAAGMAAVVGTLGGLCCCAGVGYFGIKAIFCWFIAKAVKRVPEAQRQMTPGQVWLWLIPFFDIVWTFFIASRIPGSIRAALDAQGRSEGGDCGKGIGVATGICLAMSTVFSGISVGSVPAGADWQTALQAGGGMSHAANALGFGAIVLLIIFTVTIVNRSKLLAR